MSEDTPVYIPSGESKNESPAEPAIPWGSRHAWFGILSEIILIAATILLVTTFPNTELLTGPGMVLLELLYLIPVMVLVWQYRPGWSAFGFRRFKAEHLGIGCGLLIGSYALIIVHNFILIALGVEIQADTIVNAFGQLDTPVWFILTGVVAAPLVEEVVFRGYIFAGFRKKYGWKAALLISSIGFALMHLQPAALIPTFILGAVLGYLYHKSNSLWPGIILHFLVNSFGLCSAYALTQFPIQ